MIFLGLHLCVLSENIQYSRTKATNKQGTILAFHLPLRWNTKKNLEIPLSLRTTLASTIDHTRTIQFILHWGNISNFLNYCPQNWLLEMTGEQGWGRPHGATTAGFVVASAQQPFHLRMFWLYKHSGLARYYISMPFKILKYLHDVWILNYIVKENVLVIFLKSSSGVLEYYFHTFSWGLSTDQCHSPIQ